MASRSDEHGKLRNDGDGGRDEDHRTPLPEVPSSVLVVQPARLIEDVDEEVFLLWTLNPMPAERAGLGYVDSSRDSLYLSVRSGGWRSAPRRAMLELEDVVEIHQDVTSLRSAKGNTGSVVWRSTLNLAVAILGGRLLDPAKLTATRVLELGSGTGALGGLLASRTSSWLATDQAELLPLIRRNLAAACNATAMELDWFDFLRPPSVAFRDRSRQRVLDGLSGDFPDLIVCADCVYNPALFEALTATLTVFTQPRRTIVLVVAEMRTDEGIAEFLSAWQHSHASWSILSLEDRLDAGFVAFAAWRT